MKKIARKFLERLILNNQLEAVGLGLILLASIFFRFWQLKNLFIFTMDEEYEAFLIRQIIHLSHWPLIGVNAADTGLYLGPGILYLGALPYWLFHGNPVGVAFLGSTLGVITTLAVWWVARQWAGKLAGFFSGLTYAGSWLIAIYDRRFWNPSLIPLLSLVIVFSLWKVVKGYPRWLIILGLALGGVFHSHLSGLIFFPLVFIFLAWTWLRQPSSFKPKWVAGGIVAFIIMISPLLIFDLRRDFTNTRAAIKLTHTLLFDRAKGVEKSEFSSQSGFSTNFSSNFNTLGRILLVPGNHHLATQAINCPETNALKSGSPLGLGILGFSLAILLWQVFGSHLQNLIPASKGILRSDFIGLRMTGTDRLDKKLALILILTVIFSNGLWSVLTGYQAEYYWLPSFPFIAILVGWGIASIFTSRKPGISFPKFLSLGVVFGLLIFNLASLLKTKNEFGLETKQRVFSWVKDQIDHAPFRLESWGQCHRQEGYTYLASNHLDQPVISYTDPNFSWIYGHNQVEPEYQVDLISFSQDESEATKSDLLKKAEELKTTAFAQEKFGSIIATITQLP